MAVHKSLLMTIVSWSFTLVTGNAHGKPDEVAEYCYNEHFNVSCERGQVIVMQTARYGRMGIGRCVSTNLGYLPCEADVMDIMTSRCTGRRSCDVEVNDEQLSAKEPCSHDVTWHLEASYKCVPVLSHPSPTQCRYSDSQSQSVLLNTTHYVSTQSALTSGNCPWNLRAKKGQTLALSVYNTLLDYGGADGSLLGANDGYSCTAIGYVTEEGGQTGTLNVCQNPDAALGEPTRRTLLFVSKGHSIKLTLYSSSLNDPYLIRLDVKGCPNITTPPHATVRRHGDTVQVTCNNSADSWALVCTDNKWVGNPGNCTVESKGTWAMPHIFQDGNILPMGILIAVALGVALGIFLGGLLLVIVGSRMKRKQRQRLQQAAFADVADCDVTDQVPQHYPSKSPGSATLSSNMEYTLSRGPDHFSSLNECDRPYTYRKAPSYGGEADHTKCCKSPYHPYETPTLT